jgi:hypothetical protein
MDSPTPTIVEHHHVLYVNVHKLARVALFGFILTLSSRGPLSS